MSKQEQSFVSMNKKKKKNLIKVRVVREKKLEGGLCSKISVRCRLVKLSVV